MDKFHNAPGARLVAPIQSPSLASFLREKFAESEEPTTALPPVESSALSDRTAPVKGRAAGSQPAVQACRNRCNGQFAPVGWEVHLKLLMNPGMHYADALLEVKRHLRANAHRLWSETSDRWQCATEAEGVDA